MVSSFTRPHFARYVCGFFYYYYLSCCRRNLKYSSVSWRVGPKIGNRWSRFESSMKANSLPFSTLAVCVSVFSLVPGMAVTSLVTLAGKLWSSQVRNSSPIGIDTCSPGFQGKLLREAVVGIFIEHLTTTKGEESIIWPLTWMYGESFLLRCCGWQPKCETRYTTCYEE